MEFLKVDKLKKSYEGHVALKEVSFSVPKGSIFGLLGPNGAGKTTFIRILNRIIAYDSGEIFFDGDPLAEKHVNRIGYLPEERGLYRKMKVGEQILYFAQLKGLSYTEAYRRAKDLMRKFDMSSWWDKKLQELSKGMQQKVQFLITIIHDPDLLIFDEPFTGFDPINQEMLKNEIIDLNKRGKTILFSTHQMASVEELCDSIVLINEGQIILSGNLQQIKQQYKKNIFLLQFRSPQVQFVETGKFKIIDFRNGIYKIQITDETAVNDLINYALGLGPITMFKEELPSLNEIFISAVHSSNTKNVEV